MLAWQNSWRHFGMLFVNMGLMVAESFIPGEMRLEP